MSTEKAQLQEQIVKYSSRIAKQLLLASEENKKSGDADSAKYCSDTAKYISEVIRKADGSHHDDIHVSISRTIKSIPLDVFKNDQERTTYEKNVRQIIIATRDLQ